MTAYQFRTILILLFVTIATTVRADSFFSPSEQYAIKLAATNWAQQSCTRLTLNEAFIALNIIYFLHENAYIDGRARQINAFFFHMSQAIRSHIMNYENADTNCTN